MLNRKLLIALAASSVVGLSLPALAQGGCSGVYVGGQLGWGQVSHQGHSHRHHSESSGAVRQEGEGRHHNNHSNNQDGLAGRAYLGYQFNQYFGVETGFAGFSSEQKSNGHRHHREGNQVARDSSFDENWKVKTTQWDLLAKIGTPFGDSCFRGDVKLGAAAVFANNDHHNHRHGNRAEHHHDSNNTQYGPAAGASVSYNFTRNVAMDVSYLHVFGDINGNDNHDHDKGPNTDLVTLGVSYLFIM